MADDSLSRTPLHAWHTAHGGRLVEFGGWSMPVQYTSIVEEHQAVRKRVGLFDISHMGRLLFDGPGTLDWLERLTTNQVARLGAGQIQYSLMARDDGGTLDDILVYRLPEAYGVVCNASNRAKVLDQFSQNHEGREAVLLDRTIDTAMIAVQGPRALETLQRLADTPLEDVAYYHSLACEIHGHATLASRTGYTGEDGFELIVAADSAERIWTALLDAGREFGILPCGLGARDTLRFEAAMPLYGHELAEEIDPVSAGLGWAVKFDKGDFIGRDALRACKSKPRWRRVGLELEGKRIARQGYDVLRDGKAVGFVTSGTFSPTLERSLAMALVEISARSSGGLSVDIRGRPESARVVPLPFYQRPAETPVRTAREDGG